MFPYASHLHCTKQICSYSIMNHVKKKKKRPKKYHSWRQWLRPCEVMTVELGIVAPGIMNTYSYKRTFITNFATGLLYRLLVKCCSSYLLQTNTKWKQLRQLTCQLKAKINCRWQEAPELMSIACSHWHWLDATSYSLLDFLNRILAWQFAEKSKS